MEFFLDAIPPFNFDLSATIFSDGDRQIQKYQDGNFWQVLGVNNKLILTAVKALGNVEAPSLSVNVKPDKEIELSDLTLVKKKVSSFFNLGFDVKPFYHDAKNDLIMTGVIRKLWGLRSPTTNTIFEALIDSIIEQQISLNVAHILQRKVIKTFGDRLSFDDEVYYAYPTAEKLASASIGELHKCGLSQKKADYVKNVSNLVVSGGLNLEKLESYEDTNEIVKQLDEIRGIGIWTAELTLVRGMHKFDAFPADDLGLRRVISHYYNNDIQITSQEARRMSQRWGKWKGLASYYLIVAERLEKMK